MSNVLKIAIFILLIVLIIFIQFYVISSKSLFGIKPNLILVLVIVACIYLGGIKGSIFGLSVGVILDFIYSLNGFGIYTLTYTIVALFIGYVKEKYVKCNIISAVYLTIIGSVIFELLQYFRLVFGYGVNIGIFRMLFGIVLFSILNCVIGIIIYNILGKILKKDSINIYF